MLVIRPDKSNAEMKKKVWKKKKKRKKNICEITFIFSQCQNLHFYISFKLFLCKLNVYIYIPVYRDHIDGFIYVRIILVFVNTDTEKIDEQNVYK